MKGRWAAGIAPRNFAWILKGQLAVSERPGGFAPNHRRVRRQEEILWLGAQGFTRIVSLLPSNHNLHAYEELHIPASHYALPAHGDPRAALADLYEALWGWLRNNERVLLHQDELGEQVAGVVAGFLCWSQLLPEPPQAVSAVEHLLKRQMGHHGRSLAAAAAELPPARLARERTASHQPPASTHPSATHPSAGHPSAGHPSAGHPSAGHPSTEVTSRPPLEDGVVAQIVPLLAASSIEALPSEAPSPIVAHPTAPATSSSRKAPNAEHPRAAPPKPAPPKPAPPKPVPPKPVPAAKVEPAGAEPPKVAGSRGRSTRKAETDKPRGPGGAESKRGRGSPPEVDGAHH